MKLRSLSRELSNIFIGIIRIRLRICKRRGNDQRAYNSVFVIRLAPPKCLQHFANTFRRNAEPEKIKMEVNNDV
ncbi:TPA: hypothetical protein EYP66_18085 [Candidatus Poribacteria bacterium]|nr:hypothetical protein [Candidatus Poribacteria bacterium]